MTHIMLDLETWGKVPGSDIRSIGAVVFDPVHGYTAIPCGDENNDVKSFYIETIEWWNDQTPEAQTAFANPVDLREACLQFAIWLESVNPVKPVPRYPDEVNGPEIRIWANDPHFDVSILDAVFRAVGLPVPWHYRSPRSMKTITEAAGMTSADYSNYGTAHNALDDAIAQAMTVCEAYKRLGLQR